MTSITEFHLSATGISRRDGQGDRVGRIVMVGSGVKVANGGPGLCCSWTGSRSRCRGRTASDQASASTEATPRIRIVPAMPPRIHGIQFTLRWTTNLKLGGTEIGTTVMLSWPPRWRARSRPARLLANWASSGSPGSRRSRPGR